MLEEKNQEDFYERRARELARIYKRQALSAYDPTESTNPEL